MPYGTLKCDNIVFTNGGSDQTITVSGLIASTSGNLTVTGTVQGGTIIGTSTISGATITGNTGQFTTLTGGTAGFTTVTGTTVTGTTANFASGVFTTQISGATVTGNVGSFATITGGVVTLTSGVFAAGSASAPSISFSSDSNTGIYSPGADQVAISTSGAQRLVVDASGNVGVGTSSPIALVQAEGGIFVSRRYGSFGGALEMYQADGTISAPTASSANRQTGALAGLGYDGSAYRTTSRIRLFSSDAVTSTSAPGHITFETVAPGSTAVSERLRITAAGLVGVGVSSPGARLHVGTSSLSGNWSGFFGDNLAGAIAPPANYGLSFGYNRSNGAGEANIAYGTGTGGGAGLFFASYDGTTYTNRVIFDGAGRVAIGTTSAGANIDVRPPSGAGASLRIRNSPQSDGSPNDIIVGVDSTSLYGTAYIDTSKAGVAAVTPLVFKIDGSEKARLDQQGRLLVGTSSASGFVTESSTAKLVIAGNTTGFGQQGLLVLMNGEDPVLNNYTLGSVLFAGEANAQVAASISAAADGEWNTSGDTTDSPGRLVFSTTADGASSPTERVRITSTGQVSIASGIAVIDTATSNAPYLSLASAATNATGAELRMGARVSSSSTSAGIKAIHPDGSDPDFVSIGIYVRNSGTSTDPALEIARADYQGSFRPGADNVRPLGNASFRWSEVFAGTGTINTSDETLKEDIQDLEQAELTVASEIKSLIKKFRFKDAVASKGDDARIHVGVIAQEVEQVFVDNGLDPRRYALFCEDTLEDGNKRLGIRYDELLAFVITAL